VIFSNAGPDERSAHLQWVRGEKEDAPRHKKRRRESRLGQGTLVEIARHSRLWVFSSSSLRLHTVRQAFRAEKADKRNHTMGMVQACDEPTLMETPSWAWGSPC